jgi:hypothetical protein
MLADDLDGSLSIGAFCTYREGWRSLAFVVRGGDHGRKGEAVYRIWHAYEFYLDYTHTPLFHCKMVARMELVEGRRRYAR